MAFPTVIIQNRTVILLSGFDPPPGFPSVAIEEQTPAVFVVDWEQLVEAVKADCDGVAFGYTEGRWRAAA